MSWQYTPFTWLFMVSAAAMVALTAYAWRRRAVAAAVPFAITSATVAVWASASALELAGADLPTKLFWANVQYFCHVTIPVAWLAATLQYTGRGHWLTGRRLAGLCVVPLITVALVWTDQAHGLVRQNLHLDSAGALPVLAKTYGPWFWVHTAYSYLLLLLSVVMLAAAVLHASPLQRGQSLALLIGMLIPLISNVTYVLRIGPALRTDVSPLFFVVSGSVVAWSLFRFHLFDIVPIARSKVIEGMIDGVVVLDAERRVIDLNPAAVEILGCPFSEATGRHASDLFGQWPDLVELCGAATSAQTDLAVGSGAGRRCYEVRFSPLTGRGGRSIGQVIVFHDVTERIWQEQQLAYLATHDALTDLPNRRSVEDALTRLLARHRRRGTTGTLLFIDLDHFKIVNDTLGHAGGDQVLVALTRRLRERLRAEDLLARLGGDEFAILLEETDVARALDVADRLRAVVHERPFVLGRHSFVLGLSIGVAAVAGQATPSVVLSQADSALYRAKAQGRNRAVVYEPDEHVSDRFSNADQWAARLRGALDEGRLAVHYQPVVRLADGWVDHYEALLRLLDEEQGIVYPGAFIHSAEQLGLMPRLTRWVVAEVIGALAAHPSARVSVNLFDRWAADAGLVEFVEARLVESRVEPERLGFEVAESALAPDRAAAGRGLARLRGLGCRLTLEGLGADSGPVATWPELPADWLKLDGALVRALEHDPSRRALVRTILATARSLNREVIAPSVENEALVRVLEDVGVAYGQGYALGRPLPALPIVEARPARDLGAAV